MAMELVLCGRCCLQYLFEGESEGLDEFIV